jgi:hypothetical protein
MHLSYLEEISNLSGTLLSIMGHLLELNLLRKVIRIESHKKK